MTVKVGADAGVEVGELKNGVVDLLGELFGGG